jgi:hypothetical protein
VGQVAHVVAVQMVDKDLVHPAEADIHGIVVGAHPRAAFEHDVVQGHLPGIIPTHLHEDAHHLLFLAQIARDGGSHERDAHLIFAQRRNGGFGLRTEWVVGGQLLEVGVPLRVDGVIPAAGNRVGAGAVSVFANVLRDHVARAGVKHGAPQGEATHGQTRQLQ